MSTHQANMFKLVLQSEDGERGGLSFLTKSKKKQTVFFTSLNAALMWYLLYTKNTICPLCLFWKAFAFNQKQCIAVVCDSRDSMRSLVPDKRD